MRAAPLILLMFALVACRSSRKSQPAAPSVDQPKAETEVFAIRAHKVIAKSKHVRIWVTLENKTDQQITASYGDFVLERDGVTYPGALRVPFARVTKRFEMTPRMVKRFPDAIEFLGAPPSGTGTIRLVRYTVNGVSADCDLALAFPIANATWP